MAVKNNVDVLYFACLVPMNVYFVEDGQMDKRIFLATWKDIPTQNEVQYTLTNMSSNSGKLSVTIGRTDIELIIPINELRVYLLLTFFYGFTDAVVQKMHQSNIFTIAKRNVENQDMLYQSLKLTNDVWVLVEMKIPPGGSVFTVRKS